MFLVCHFNLNNKNDCNKLNAFLNHWKLKYSTETAVWNIRRKTKLFSLIRSPHVNKTSQQQLKLNFFEFKIAVKIVDKKKFFSMLEYLYNVLNILQLKITVYKT
jgi:hypothetical protein